MEDHRPDTGPPAQITQRSEDPNSAHGADQHVTIQVNDTEPTHTYPHTRPPGKKHSTSETPPHRRKPLLPLQLMSLLPALLGIALLSGVLSGLPSAYRRTWHFLWVDHRGHLTQRERSEWVKPFKNHLRSLLFTTLCLLVASFLWTFLAILTRVTTRAHRGFHPGVHIAASLLLFGALAYASVQGLRWALIDFDRGDKMRAKFWLSNVRDVYYTGERGHGPPEHGAPGAWYWTGDPDPASNTHKYWLACAGFGLGLILATLHFLRFLAASRDLNVRNKQHRQDLKDHISGKHRVAQGTSPGHGRLPSGEEGLDRHATPAGHATNAS